MHEWMMDNGFTPHIVADATVNGLKIPNEHVKEGKIVLNVSHSATRGLVLGNDEIAFDDIAAAFRRYSLVEVSTEQNSFTVHRLVQTVTRARMTDDERAKWAEAAGKSVNRMFPGDDFREQPETWLSARTIRV